MPKHTRPILLFSVVLLLVVGIGGLVVWRLMTGSELEDQRQGGGIVAVEAAPIQRTDIEDRRVFSGTLATPAEVRVAPKVGGRIMELHVDLGDTVERGQVVAELDSAEYQQAVAQAEAELVVAQANLSEATAALEIAQRDLRRNEGLQQEGIVSEAVFDTVRAAELAARSQVEVAEAQVLRAESAVESAKIRLGYTTVNAEWRDDSESPDGGGDERRVVAERFVEEGDTVAANTPLLRVVTLDPIQAVIYVTERDYAGMAPGQPVTLRTDAYPGETFAGEVSVIAPTFNEASRQARVELTVDNPELRLKPGLFARAEAVLDREADALVVPEVALTERAGQESIFVIDDATRTVRLVPVELGIHQGGLVQVTGEGLEAGQRVVTLGQQLLDEGTPVTVPEPTTLTTAATDSAGGATR